MTTRPALRTHTNTKPCAVCNDHTHDSTEHFPVAFTNPVSGEPYPIPDDLREAAERICRSYGIRGICDPMYVANVIATELSIGTGESTFTAPDARWQPPATDETCDGFANYATAQIGLWCDNDRAELDRMRNRVRDARDVTAPSLYGVDRCDRTTVACTVAEAIKEWADQTHPGTGDPWSGLLLAGLGDVDWLDLAHHYLDDLAECEAGAR